MSYRILALAGALSISCATAPVAQRPAAADPAAAAAPALRQPTIVEPDAPATQPGVPEEPEARERARIRAARASEQERSAELERACYARFAVNDCLIEVRRARRDVLADLRRQELSLNDAQRKRRAAEQLLRSDNKASGQP